MIRSILQHVLGQGQSQRCCVAALGLSKGAVTKYVTAAAAAGLDWATAQSMSEAELAARLAPRRVAGAQVLLPDFARIHRELSRKGMTLHIDFRLALPRRKPRSRSLEALPFQPHLRALRELAHLSFFCLDDFFA